MSGVSVNFCADVLVMLVGALSLRESLTTAIHYARLEGPFSRKLLRNFLAESWASFVTLSFGFMALLGVLNRVPELVQAGMRLSMLGFMMFTTRAARVHHMKGDR